MVCLTHDSNEVDIRRRWDRRHGSATAVTARRSLAKTCLERIFQLKECHASCMLSLPLVSFASTFDSDCSAPTYVAFFYLTKVDVDRGVAHHARSSQHPTNTY